MLPHPITNLNIQRHYQNENKFNQNYSCDKLPDKKKDETNSKNLNRYANVGAHWIALYSNGNIITYFNSFGVKHIPKEIKKFIKGSTITKSIFRLQAYDSAMCRYVCIGFIDFLNNLFS